MHTHSRTHMHMYTHTCLGVLLGRVWLVSSLWVGLFMVWEAEEQRVPVETHPYDS